MTGNTITLKGNPIQKERFASAALSPGHLLEVLSTGKVQKNTNASVLVSRNFALENEVLGEDLTDAYAAEDTVLYGAFPAGAEVNARVAVGATAIVIGDRLEAAADGTVRKLSTADNLTLTGAVTDDDSAASNGLVVYLHLDETSQFGTNIGHLESVTAGNADSDFDIGASGPTVRIKDDDAAATAGLQIYFDEDAANADSRFLVNNTLTGKDAVILATDGRAIRIKHDASASSNGVALYFDDDAVNEEARLLFVSPTDTAGVYTTDDEIGMYTNVNAVQAIATALEAVDNSAGSAEVFIQIELY